ncbi:MAG TPA: sigma-70 family RNA polymerase sigma factor [Acidimicrobiia bacterium]|jgi:RNA polymerase sigma-70 factor, ECF subfamily|nr:sigma-70 family RNA polymerase sigma factor [Acidimicrobiia bacterium]
MAVDPPYARTDDVGLVIAIARYNGDAFAEAYRRHAGAVFALAQRLLWERALAEELVQETFLRLWEHPDRFDQARGSLRSFLLMDAHARGVDRIRSDSRRREREERTARAAVVADYDLDLEAYDLDVAEQVREVMATLTDGERRAIELAYFGGHTYREVARILAEPEGTIKSRIRTGLMRLRTQLLDRGIDGSWIVN